MNVAFYETFVAKAAEGRKKKPAEIEAVAQGRVWTGAQALEAGLVDSPRRAGAAVRAGPGEGAHPEGAGGAAPGPAARGRASSRRSWRGRTRR